MSVKIKINDYDCDLDNSKFFGEILLPEKWLEDDVFSPDEMFLCQINLDEVYESVGKTTLPESGMLYFFIDYQKKPLAVVRYTDDEVDAYTSFNEDWDGDYDVCTEWQITFETSDDLQGSSLLVKDDNIKDGEIALLKYVPDETTVDFLSDKYKALYFVIEKDDLKRGDFSQVTLRFVKK